MTGEEEPVFFRSRNEWRAWLRKNHRKVKRIWLGYYNKHARRGWLIYPEALEEALCWGWIDGQVRKIDRDTFKQRFTPRSPKSRWSLVNKRKAERLVAEGRMTKAGLAAIVVAKENGNWERAYTSRVELEAPKDLERALKRRRGAWKRFKEFLPSHRTRYIDWIFEAKKVETRRRRIEMTVDRVARNVKPGVVENVREPTSRSRRPRPRPRGNPGPARGRR